jgi:hypothetical protein
MDHAIKWAFEIPQHCAGIINWYTKLLWLALYQYSSNMAVSLIYY